MRSVLAVDIGATKLAAAVVEETGRILERDEVPTQPMATVAEEAPLGDGEPRGPGWIARPGTDGSPSSDGPPSEELWDRLAALVANVQRAAGTRPAACGVGTAGPLDGPHDTVSPLNIPAWRDFPLRRRLEVLTGLPVAVELDAKALALGEGWLGEARGVPDYVAMVVSSGVGGGVVLGGRLLHGAAGNAGHIGHVQVVPGGRRCACGWRGCLEAEASGLAIQALTGAAPRAASPAVIERTGTLVGRAAGSVANLLDLGLFVVAGSVALGFGAPFFAAAQAALDEAGRIGTARGARIVPAGLGGEGPLLGAAAVALGRG